MRDTGLYRWAGPDPALIELLLDGAETNGDTAPLRSLRGLEEEVSCLLEPFRPTVSAEAS
jgi:hypothetical protein